MSTTRVRRSSQNIFRTKKPIVNKIPKIICIGISVSMAFCGLLFGQQAQKEYIYLDGRIVAVESRSYSPPTFAITSPTSDSSYDTGSSSITLAGTASPEVTSVIWTNSNGGNGNCTGTTSWSCSITGLQNGTNVLTVTGRNGDYGFVADSLTVYYCTYSIAPASAGKTAGAGSGSVALTSSNGGCRWTADRSVGWIKFAPGGSATADGTGSGVVNYTVDANPGPERTGTLTIAGQTHTVTQANGCTYTISSATASPGAGSGSGSVTVTPSNSACSWTASSNATSWLTVGSGSGTGTTAVSYSYAANTGPARTGVITLGGRTHTVTQASGCTYTISSATASPGAGSGSGSVTVTPSNSACSWTASSNATSWLTVGSGSGTGTTAVSYSYAANTGPARTGVITLGGRTHTVTQASGCTYTISATSALLLPNAQSASVGVTAASVCPWTAAVTSAANPQWLTITSGASGNGSGTVSYSVTANSGSTRTGVLTIGNQIFTVRQVSAACSSQCAAAAAACAAAGGACVDQCIATTCPMNPGLCGPYCQAMCAVQGGGVDCNAVYNQCLEGCD